MKIAEDQNIETRLMVRHLTPSVASTTNSSFSLRWWQETSGTAIKPKSFKQKSPKALAIARPGESLSGSQTRKVSGSFWRAKILPLQSLILSASPIKRRNKMFYTHKQTILLHKLSIRDPELFSQKVIMMIVIPLHQKSKKIYRTLSKLVN